MSKPRKILVCGSVHGRLDQLFGRVRTILKKNSDFELLLCVGSFFGLGEDAEKSWQQYQNGTADVPIETYILGPTTLEQKASYGESLAEDGGELCKNLTYLGRKGILKTSSGLQIAYLGGHPETEGSSKAQGCCFNTKDVEDLERTSEEEKFVGVDILITYCWPQGVTEFAHKPMEGFDSQSSGSSLVSRLATRLRPRYHFAGYPETHYERAPYRNHQVLKEAARHVTRFIGLASVGNPHKKKYMYAFNIVPLCNMDKAELVNQPTDVTELPYRKTFAAKPPQQAGGQQQNFFFDAAQIEKQQKRKRENEDGQGPRQPRMRKGPPPLKGSCWFCLGSPEVEKHLVVSVGKQSYVALAKGGLVSDHVLICPVAHFESTVKLAEDVLMEMEKYLLTNSMPLNKYKFALKQLYKSEGKSCVMFERNFYTQHLQLQVVPVQQMDVEELKDAFRDCANASSMELRDIPSNADLKESVPVGAPYFVVEFDNGDRLLHRVRGKMPIQFGREALAGPSILNTPEKVDWKACKQSMDEEKATAAAFRKKFKPFDFNLS